MTNEAEITTITYERMTEFTEQFTEAELLDALSRPWDYPEELIAAIMDHVRTRPRGITREQFDALPDATILTVRGHRFMKRGDALHALIPNTAAMINPPLGETEIVSIPEPPTLDDVARCVDAETQVWERFGDEEIWQRASLQRESKTLRTDELLAQYGPVTLLLEGPRVGDRTEEA